MGYIKNMVTRQSEEPGNVAAFNGFALTRGFDGNPLIDTADDGIQPDVADEQEAPAPRPRKPRSRVRQPSAQPALPIGDLVAGMDLNDPAHVAELAARYRSMNDSMKRLAQEKASLMAVVAETEAALSEAETTLKELQRQQTDLGRELVHAREKLEIATKSSGAIFERTMFSVLKWSSIGSILLFVLAFIYF